MVLRMIRLAFKRFFGGLSTADRRRLIEATERNRARLGVR